MNNLDLTQLPGLPLSKRHNLPRAQAVYFVVRSPAEVLYIGQSQNLRERWSTHHISGLLNDDNQITILWLTVEAASDLNALETSLIKHLRPQLNRNKHNPKRQTPGLKQISGFLTIETHKELRKALIDDEKDFSELLQELVDGWLASRLK